MDMNIPSTDQPSTTKSGGSPAPPSPAPPSKPIEPTPKPAEAPKPIRYEVKAKHSATERLAAIHNGGTLKDGDKVLYQHFDTTNKRAQFVAEHLSFRCLGECCNSDPQVHYLFDVNELEDHWGRYAPESFLHISHDSYRTFFAGAPLAQHGRGSDW